MIVVKVRDRDIKAAPMGPVTTGSVGLPVSWHFSEEWDDLAKTAVFRVGNDGTEITVAVLEDLCLVPDELLVQANAGENLWIGVYGWEGEDDGEGNVTIAMPTIWTYTRIQDGSQPSGIEPPEGTPGWSAQIQNATDEALRVAHGVAADAAAGEFDGISPAVTISSITHGHSVTISDRDHPTGQSFNVMDGDSAYEQAVAGGYTGTEAQFNEELASFKELSEQAADSATAAAQSESNADASAQDAEAYAVGKRDGTDVGSTDPAYHNNAKYYAEQASSSATAASGSATAAASSATAAGDAQTAAETAQGAAEDAQAAAEAVLASIPSDYTELSGDVDDLKRQVEPFREIEFISGYYIPLNSNTIDINNPTPSSSGYRYAVIECKPGDKFTINCTGGAAPRIFAFINDDGNRLTVGPASITVKNSVITAVPGSTKCIINDNSGGHCFYGAKNPIENTSIITITGKDVQSGNVSVASGTSGFNNDSSRARIPFINLPNNKYVFIVPAYGFKTWCIRRNYYTGISEFAGSTSVAGFPSIFKTNDKDMYHLGIAHSDTDDKTELQYNDDTVLGWIYCFDEPINGMFNPVYSNVKFARAELVTNIGAYSVQGCATDGVNILTCHETEGVMHLIDKNTGAIITTKSFTPSQYGHMNSAAYANGKYFVCDQSHNAIHVFDSTTLDFIETLHPTVEEASVHYWAIGFNPLSEKFYSLTGNVGDENPGLAVFNTNFEDIEFYPRDYQYRPDNSFVVGQGALCDGHFFYAIVSVYGYTGRYALVPFDLNSLGSREEMYPPVFIDTSDGDDVEFEDGAYDFGKGVTYITANINNTSRLYKIPYLYSDPNYSL